MFKLMELLNLCELVFLNIGAPSLQMTAIASVFKFASVLYISCGSEFTNRFCF